MRRLLVDSSLATMSDNFNEFIGFPSASIHRHINKRPLQTGFLVIFDMETLRHSFPSILKNSSFFLLGGFLLLWFFPGSVRVFITKLLSVRPTNMTTSQCSNARLRRIINYRI